MNEKLQYASMLEIPVNTCTVTNKAIKKRKIKKKKAVDPNVVKEQLLEKINNLDTASDVIEKDGLEQENSLQLIETTQNDLEIAPVQNTATVTENVTKKRKRFKFSVIGVQFAVIAILMLTIMVTSAIFPNSGISVFFNNVFSAEQVEAKDLRAHTDFVPVIAMGDNKGLAVSEGVISFGGKGSVYTPCNGVVSAIQKDEQGKFSIEITHSENFKTLLTGVEYSYVSLNDKVFSTIPVGYLLDDGASMCFYNGQGTIISDYTLVDNSVVWAV